MESEDGAEAYPANGCAICFQKFNSVDVIHLPMPCCGRAPSSMQYCKRCLEIIAETNTPTGVGKCPTCSKYFRFEDGHLVPLPPLLGTCRMCLQTRALPDPTRLCEKCLLGRLYCLRYQCERCSNVQVIPHPMWTYQPSPGEFGNVTWACHRRCFDYTHWRLLPEDADRIPPNLCPESWGRREEWLTNIRSIRMTERANGFGCTVS